MAKVVRVSITLLACFLFSVKSHGQATDLLKDVNFEETNSMIKDIDVSAYLRDITSDLEALDEKYTTDSSTRAETYVALRLQKIQELVNKPGSDCMTKYDLIAYKGQIFSDISLKGLNPFILDLRNMVKVKKDAKKAIYDQMVLDANTAIASAEKTETAVNVKMAKTIVSGKIDSIILVLNAMYAKDVSNINSLAYAESVKNMGVRNSLEPVEASKAGKNVCYKIQIKKIPDPVPAVPVANQEGTENTDGSSGANENGENVNYENTDGTIPPADSTTTPSESTPK